MAFLHGEVLSLGRHPNGLMNTVVRRDFLKKRAYASNNNISSS